MYGIESSDLTSDQLNAVECDLIGLRSTIWQRREGIRLQLTEWETNESVSVWSYIDLIEQLARDAGVRDYRYNMIRWGVTSEGSAFGDYRAWRLADESKSGADALVALVRARFAEFQARNAKAVR